ncbi:Oxygen-insensitive NAD(P)H nitroreductase [Crateriforma conspicua]|uniref:Oxygen-insensitive NAD(P)H nitroreductase n=1 Tax=Crateriforma conspicua TaxID=2527996 RepID=A0A5C5Y0R8_9PLAN|nr:oxygen-insensitive NAD(P)H nitroreductase [Crateriforma conspicua]TWT68784.1 Oxygen-insensitive NAD(P)H nitroreductase [Crateriforma conspicua]
MLDTNVDCESDTESAQLDIVDHALNRYSAKAYDPERKISPENVEKIKKLLRFSPSSVNSQPWHFVLASTDEGKERVAKGTDEKYPFNSGSIRAGSHVVVFCSRLDIQQDYLTRLLQQEERDGRFDADPSFKDKMNAGRNLFINLHKHDFKDVQHWMDKQVYLNIGAFLLGVAALGIDATPMEGIDVKALDEELGLRQKGFTSLVVVTLGYHDAEKDYNADLPKSRLPYSEILTEI